MYGALHHAPFYYVLSTWSLYIKPQIKAIDKTYFVNSEIRSGR